MNETDSNLTVKTEVSPSQNADVFSDNPYLSTPDSKTSLELSCYRATTPIALYNTYKRQQRAASTLKKLVASKPSTKTSR